MNIIELLTWTAVELSTDKPNLTKVRAAIDDAILAAAKLDINFEVRTMHLLKMAQVFGSDELMGGGRKES